MKKPILLFFLLFICFSIRLAGQISFSAPVTIDTFRWLSNMEHCYTDLDQDGDLDFVFADPDSQRVFWYEQDKYHFLNERTALISDVIADVIVPVDLDQDGYTDLILKNWSTRKWHWYKNLGNAQFDAGQAITDTVDFYTKIKVLDFDQDGDQDIVYTVPGNQFIENKLVWAANDGNNLFGAPQLLLPDTTLVISFALEDLNADGLFDLTYVKLDITATVDYSELRVALNDGTGHFPVSKSEIPHAIGNFFITDVDQDHIPDILLQTVANNTYWPIVWLKNDGNGAFGLPTEVSSSTQYETFEIGDFDLDNDQDILGLKGYPGPIESLDIILNDGTGVFNTLNSFPSRYFSYSYGNELDLADWDQNGSLDVMMASEGVSVFRNDGNAHLDLQETLLHEGALGISKLNAVDLDGDGYKDLVTAQGAVTAWYRNNGDNTFGIKGLLVTDSTDAAVLQEDLDNDGDLDLIRSSPFGIFWYPNDGTGHFGVRYKIVDNTYTLAFSFKDFNGDGIPDFSHIYYIAGHYRLKLFQNNGDGTFSILLELPISNAPFSGLFLNDLDGDQYLDLYFLAIGYNQLIWLKNDGAGNFGSEHVVDLPFTISIPIFADIDSDGDMDVFSLKDDSPVSFQYLSNDGFGNFNVVKSQEFNFDQDFVTLPEIADLDQDLDLDMVLCTADGILVFENTGTGTFNDPISIPFPLSDYTTLDLSDINADGKKDLLVLSGYPSNVYWFENQSIVSTSESPNFTGSIQISPNPAASETTITIQTEEPQNQYLIELSDARGRLVKSLRSDATTIRLTRGQLPAGFYGVRVREAQNGRLIGVGALVWR